MSKAINRFPRRIALAAVVCTLGAYASPSLAQTISTNTTGTNNGFFYSFWNDGTQGSASMTLGSAGNYSTTWNNVGNFTAGKGWSNGGRKGVNFSGSFNGGSNGYLALYGWTENPIIEYYILENHAPGYTPPGSGVPVLGTITSDGGTYNIYKIHIPPDPNRGCITGTNCDFYQYWSVRTTTRTSGTVTTGNHFDAWAKLGMPMGTKWDYMIMETEGYHSSGNSNITVSQAANVAPVLNWMITVPLSGHTPSFRDTSTDGDGTITSRIWTFGDGSTSSAVNVSHVYKAPGLYTVSLTVTDDGGLKSTRSVQINVRW